MAMKYWWGQRGMERKVHWLSKKQLYHAKDRGGMGFRELSLFNSAMLARQGWRLIQFPNSLLSRVLKAKYYPNQSFLEASVKSNPSLTWRSICGAKQALMDGLVWRVGTGENIRIWKDSWLMGSPCPKILSAPRVLEANATVAELINQEQGCWNSMLIDQIFAPSEAEIIKQIPLSSRRPQDKLIWAGNRKWVFSVKNAYHLLLQKANVNTESSSAGSLTKFWNGVWSAKVQPKIQNFIWRACRNILPTQTKLFDKKISSSFSCKWCEDEPETGDHILWQCDFAQRVWNACLVPIPSGVDVTGSFSDFLDCCLRDLDSPEIEIIMTVAWMLWVARNELMWEGINSNVDDICTRASGVALEFLEFGGRESLSPDFNESCEAWRPPQNGSYKLSIACHFRPDSAHVGVGILLRDHEGIVAVASGFVMQKYDDHLINFGLAVSYALQLAYETGLRQSIVIEVPSRELTGLLNMGPPCLAPSGIVIDDVHAWCGSFYNTQFVFISNVCNKASFALATEAASSLLDQVWLEECPTCILPFV